MKSWASLKDKIKSIPPDKIGHFKAGLAIGAGGVLFCILANINILIATIPVIVAAVGKEIYDYMHPEAHKAEVMDAVSTIIGGALPIIITLIL